VVSSAGLERRDYATMMAAVADLPVDVVLAAASPWSKRPDTTADAVIPANVTVGRLDLAELRSLYGRSALVVVPLEEVEFQAGITTILEAMSMGRAVVCTRTAGQTDTIVDDVTGVYVPPGDVDALRSAIESLLDDPDRAARLGRAARDWAVAHADVDVYAERLRTHVAAAIGRTQDTPP
jgi:glycosyltransferase involved in cell wall biosynthesis